MMWTEEQDQLVLAQEMSDAEIAQKVGRTAQAVGSRRYALRHRYPTRKYGSKPQRRWTASEDELAMDMSLSNEEVANATGRTIGAVQHRRDFLRKPKPECKPRKTGKWSKDEIELIMNYEMSASELAEKLGRSAGSIQSKRYHLRHGDHGTVAV